MDRGLITTMRSLLNRECSQFLSDSDGRPLLKILNDQYQTFDRVKVRQQSKQDTTNSVFNAAFNDIKRNIYKKSIFVHGQKHFSLQQISDQPLFYVFPINNFKYLYCDRITNSAEQFGTTYGELFDGLNNDRHLVLELVTDLIKSVYKTDNIKHAMENDCEIILFNLPYFYVVRADAFPTYEHLYEQIIDR